MTFIPGAGALPPPLPISAEPQGFQATDSLHGDGFNAVLDQTSTAMQPSDPEFPAIVPPATSLSQPSDVPGIGPLLGPSAPGPITGAGQIFKPLGDWLGEVNTSLQHASTLGKEFAAGENVNLHDVMVATEEADIGVSLTTQIRNKILEAYQQVMQMPV